MLVAGMIFFMLALAVEPALRYKVCCIVVNCSYSIADKSCIIHTFGALRNLVVYFRFVYL